jgi:hypothetical protein
VYRHANGFSLSHIQQSWIDPCAAYCNGSQNAERLGIAPGFGNAHRSVQAPAADEAISSYLVENQTYWQHLGQAQEGESSYVVYWGHIAKLASHAPCDRVVLEEDNIRSAQRIGQELLIDAMNP